MKNKVDTSGILDSASEDLSELTGHVFDVIELAKPLSVQNAVSLAKIVSKLSPMVGNLIEFNTVDFLNSKNEHRDLGKWKRQDPGFPDTIFEGTIQPTAGFEIKAWFPLATEITARFKDSQNHFLQDQTRVAILAWLPENVIFGRPHIIGIRIVSAASVAKARDDHYHNPPDYLVLEPEETTDRTSNLQQTNTNGYKFQGTSKEFEAAKRRVAKWGKKGLAYRPTPAYQAKVRALLGSYKYRLDTNYAKMDRIVHDEIETFKSEVLESDFKGMSVQEWSRLLSRGDEASIASALRDQLGIEDQPEEIENRVMEESENEYPATQGPSETQG